MSSRFRVMYCKAAWVPAVVCLCILPVISPGQSTQTPAIVINEIYYDPEDPSDHLEFIELINAGTTAADIGGWTFSKGITYTFPQGTTLPAGGYIVVAEDPAAIKKTFGVTCYGPFVGRMSNEGETITLRDGSGNKMDTVDYRLGFPWPTDTEGRSIELVHPSLDNSLGGSWRACGYKEVQIPPDTTPDRYVFNAQSAKWRYRKGLSEPPSEWMQPDYTEDRSWIGPATAPIGYDTEGVYPINTSLSDMQNRYTTMYLRNSFEIKTAEEMPASLRLRLFVDDGCIVWINGWEVGRWHVSSGSMSYNSLATNHEGAWEQSTLANPSDYLRVGTNVIAVHVLNTATTSSDLSFDLELLAAGSTGGSGTPAISTPGARNSVFAANAPPQIRQVSHAPMQPTSDEPIVVTAKVTDPEGVAQVSLSVQVVQPGHYVPAWLPVPLNVLRADALTPKQKNPEFHNPANWITLQMTDDGTGFDNAASDDVFTAVIPGQPNRSLVRYRITASDAAGEPLSVTVPYNDDASQNFACWVYDGVPAYVATRSVLGSPHTYSPDVLQTLPVYTLITRAQDLAQCYAYKGSDQLRVGNAHPSRKAFNWEGAFVFDGLVYDHVNYRLRGANGRYDGAGKRSMKIHFNRGREFEAKDRYGRPYPMGWRDLNVSKMFDNRTYNDYGDSNFGLTEAANSILWNLVGVPTWDAYWFHFRVVDGEQEAPNQYQGDFWGMFLAMEDYDGRFINRLGLPDGNLYKFASGNSSYLEEERHQGRDSVSDGSDCRRVDIFGAGELTWGKTEAQLRQLVNYEEYFRYLTVCEAVRQYDNDYAGERRNIAWFFEPDPTGQNPLGWLWLLPYDTDLTWGPNWNDGPQQPWKALEPGGNDGKAHTDNAGGMTGMKMEFRNYVREFRDLLWNPQTIDPMIEELADLIKDFAPADQDRWTHGVPIYASDIAGLHVVGQHNEDFTWSVQDKVADMELFAFTGNHTWSSGNLSGYVPVGGRAAVLDQISGFEGDSTAVPNTPTASYVGPAGYPLDALTFKASPFSDPQGSATFGAMKWRITEFSDVNSLDYDPADRRYEIQALWESNEITPFQTTMTIPATDLQVGQLYRVRVRMKDTSGRWSHWSPPVEFVAGTSLNTAP